MKKHIVLSVNDNPDYLFYGPIAIWAWQQFGWTTHVFYRGANPLHKPVGAFLEKADLALTKYPYEHIRSLAFLNEIEGYRSDTITQVSRLYGGCLENIQPGDMIMTGDIDMIPLSDYWHPNPDNITVYGHDLTGFGNYPICYIAMTKARWIEVMGLEGNDFNALIKRDLDLMPQAKSADFYKYWETDQDLITQRIKAVNFPKEFINRGKFPNGYAKGRVDRGAWNTDQPELIDCHMHRDIFKAFQNKGHDTFDTFQKKLNDTMRMLEKVWPDEDFQWFWEYTQAYAKLV